MITCVFFASVREAMGEDRVELESRGAETVADLLERLRAEDPRFREALTRENLLFAVNQTMVDANTGVTDGDEIAFFPPVTGG